MIVVDPEGNLFDERRKEERRKTSRRKNNDNTQDDRRSGKDRRTDGWVKELLEDETDETQEEN
ncbi:MAG: hypothetical protein IJK18_03630 [Clostridia bacterium]|nr:hypothetical protein [Clostridia bacterium]